jgi:hypothetical protein
LIYLDTKTLTRRQLAVIATASLASASLASANALAQTQTANPDYYQAALDSHRRNSATLAQFQFPMSVEPAFQFKA